VRSALVPAAIHTAGPTGKAPPASGLYATGYPLGSTCPGYDHERRAVRVLWNGQQRHLRGAEEQTTLRRGLIFGLIRLRSPTFIGIRIKSATQDTNVSVIPRTITPSPENRKVGGSDSPPQRASPSPVEAPLRTAMPDLSQWRSFMTAPGGTELNPAPRDAFAAAGSLRSMVED
jgi:hypothetical protein